MVDSQGNQIQEDFYTGGYFLTAGETYYAFVSLAISKDYSFTVSLDYRTNRHSFTNTECECGEKIVDLTLGNTETAQLLTSWDRAYFRFTPTVTHTYMLYTVDDQDESGISSWIEVYDAQGMRLTPNRPETVYDEHEANYYNYNYVKCELIAGETYYFEVRYSLYNRIGDFDVCLIPYDQHQIGGSCDCGYTGPTKENPQWCGSAAQWYLAEDGTLHIIA